MPNRKTIIKRSILCKIISCTLLLIVSAVCLYSCGDVKKNIKKDVEKHSMRAEDDRHHNKHYHRENHLNHCDESEEFSP